MTTPEELQEAKTYFERPANRQHAMVAIRDALGTIGLGHFTTLVAANVDGPGVENVCGLIVCRNCGEKENHTWEECARELRQTLDEAVQE